MRISFRLLSSWIAVTFASFEPLPSTRPSPRSSATTVAEAYTDLEPEQLMRVCLDIESGRSRTRGVPNGPRTLDIDIILFDDRLINSEFVTIPHPRYTGRRFVLEPLAEIAPDVIDPARRLSVVEILGRVRDEASVTRVESPLIPTRVSTKL